MLRSMVAVRRRDGDNYRLVLELPEKEYFDIYEDIDREAAEDIVKQYITYNGDDGRYSGVSIHHHKNTHIVSVQATLNYNDNDHTEQFTIPHHLSD